MHAWPSLTQAPRQLRLLMNASKRPCRKRTVQASWNAAAHEPLPGPPVRWRSARGRCFSSGRTRQLAAFERSSRARERAVGPVSPRAACKLEAPCLRGSSLAGSRSVEQTRAMNTVPFLQAEKSMQAFLSAQVVALVPVKAQASNPSIERTSQRPLRVLCAAAHVER